MDLESAPDGHWHFRLGPIERVVFAAAAALLVFLLGWVFRNFDNRLQNQADTMNKVVIAQAVTNAQLATLSQQLSDVPGLTRQVVEIKVQTERNSQDIHELQQVRKLR
jgi:hypothetical protein